MYKLDLHLHSQYSEDAQGSPEELKKILQTKGFHGMSLTDHNTIKSHKHAKKLTSKTFVVIPGLEISTKDGHILAYNTTKLIPKGLSVVETVEKIREDGGIPVVPHLFRNMSGIKKEKLLTIIDHLNAIEVFNGCSLPNTNIKTAKIAQKYTLGGTGGSDAHNPDYAGTSYTTVETTDLSLDTVLSAIENKKTWGYGTTMPLDYRQERMMLSIRQFFKRGFKRI